MKKLFYLLVITVWTSSGCFIFSNVYKSALCDMKTKEEIYFVEELSRKVIDFEEIKRKLVQRIDEIYALSTEELQELVGYCCDDIPTISAQELREKMKHESKSLVINVLSKRWYDDCHIKGSINVPLKELLDNINKWNRNQDIVVYCALSECNASEKACVLLKLFGFENVTEYKGGIKEWYQLGYPVEGSCASDYLQNNDTKACPV